MRVEMQLTGLEATGLTGCDPLARVRILEVIADLSNDEVFTPPAVARSVLDLLPTDVWENPEAFDPERFAPERADSYPPFTYFPFGGGSRKCIGYNLALLQMQLATAMVAQRFRVSAVPGHPVVYGRMVALRPEHGIQVTLHRRQG